MKKELSEKPNLVKGFDKIALVAVEVGHDGNITRQVCADLSKDGYWANSELGLETSDGDIIIPCLKKSGSGREKTGVKFLEIQIK